MHTKNALPLLFVMDERALDLPSSLYKHPSTPSLGAHNARDVQALLELTLKPIMHQLYTSNPRILHSIYDFFYDAKLALKAFMHTLYSSLFKNHSPPSIPITYSYHL